jgi:hypothetical protein
MGRSPWSPESAFSRGGDPADVPLGRVARLSPVAGP